MLIQLLGSWWPYLLTGLICGIYSATFGIGGGTILVPVLVLIFGFAQKSAQGTCLAVMVPMALVAAIRYKLNPNIEVDLQVAAILAIGAVVGAIIGAGIAGCVSGAVLRKMFAVIMIIVAIKMLVTKPEQTIEPPGAESQLSEKEEPTLPL
jgi:uncharacterized membrane protein YfcA